MPKSKPTPDKSPATRAAAARDSTQLGRTSALPESRPFSASTGRPGSLRAKVADLSGFHLSDVGVPNDMASRPSSAASYVSPAADLLDDSDHVAAVGAGRNPVGHELSHVVEQRQRKVIRAPDR